MQSLLSRLFKKPKKQKYEFGKPPEMTYVVYYVPPPGEQATKYECRRWSHRDMVVKYRDGVCKKGVEVAIHAGVNHPDPLPLNEILWRKP